MLRWTRGVRLMVVAAAMLCLGGHLADSAGAAGGAVPAAAKMPGNWKVVSDFLVPPAQVEAMSRKLGAELGGVRNTTCEVNGKRVQLNVIVTPDSGNAEKLLAKLRSMKVEEALLRKDLIIYEFVGQNEVLPLIAAGRNHLAAK